MPIPTSRLSIDLPGPQLQSKVISFLRFPLIVAVAYIHSLKSGGNAVASTLVDGSIPVFTCTQFLVSDVVARVAVPLFFFISGFLFFNGCTARFTGAIYLQKMKRRATTLLLPYILWNIIYLGLFLLAQTQMPDMTTGNKALIADYTPLDWLRTFWDINNGMPICCQFWFIRDLMVAMVLSPLLYMALRHMKWWFVVLLGVLWFTDTWFNITGISIGALFFFSAGGCFKIFRMSFLSAMMPYMKPALAVYPAVCVLCLIFKDTDTISYLDRTGIITGIVAAVTLSGKYLKEGKWKVSPFLAESSFFIYATHAALITPVMKMSLRLFSVNTDWTLLIIFITAPLLTVAIGLAGYYILSKYFPKFTGLICGGR